MFSRGPRQAAKFKFSDLPSMRKTLTDAIQSNFDAELDALFKFPSDLGLKLILDGPHVLACIIAPSPQALKPKDGIRIILQWRVNGRGFRAIGTSGPSMDSGLKCNLALNLSWYGYDTVQQHGVGQSRLSHHDFRHIAKEWKFVTESRELTQETCPVKMKEEANEGVYSDCLSTLNIMSIDDTWESYVLGDSKKLQTLPWHDSTKTQQGTKEDEQRWDVQVDQRFRELLKWKTQDDQAFVWNKEQRSVLEHLRNNKGEMLCVRGPAGTGKTTLIAAITWFYHAIGYHVVIDSPTNASVDDIVSRLDGLPQRVPFLRILPTGILNVFESIQARCAARSKAGDRDRNLPVSSDNSGNGESTGRQIGASRAQDLAQMILTAAADRERSCLVRLGYSGEKWDIEDQYPAVGSKIQKRGSTHTINNPFPEGKIHEVYELDAGGGLRRIVLAAGRSMDIWDLFRKFWDRMSETPVYQWQKPDGSQDISSMEVFHYITMLCTLYILARQKVICATSASSHHGRILRTTFASGILGSEPCKGVVVLKEEAARDIEPTFWGSIVHCGWADEVKMVVAFGDEHQLEPLVPGSDRSHPYRAQLQTSYFLRHVKNGGEQVTLKEQNRMHESIARAPNRLAYDNELRTAESRTRDIDSDLPGLGVSLKKLHEGLGFQSQYEMEDDELRVHAFEVPGRVFIRGNGQSRYNMEQIQFAIEKILPFQHDYFRKETRERCLWIAGYGASVSMIDQQLKNWQFARKCSPSELPRVLTIDSSQGHGADWVVMFTIVDVASDLGFMRDDRRIVVGTTRAKNVFHYVHGPFRGGFDSRTPMVYRYLQELNRDQKTAYAQPEFDRKKLPAKLQSDQER